MPGNRENSRVAKLSRQLLAWDFRTLEQISLFRKTGNLFNRKQGIGLAEQGITGKPIPLLNLALEMSQTPHDCSPTEYIVGDKIHGSFEICVG